MGKKKKNDKNDIIISALGTSKEEVTGSCWTISYPKNNDTRGLIVLECGLSQSGHTIEQQYNANKKIISNIGKDVIKSAEYVFVAHGHIDHIGNLSIFNDDNNFKGKILGSNETLEIGKELIRDTVKIHTKGVQSLRSKGKKLSYLYTEPQMLQMFEHMQSVELNKKIKLNDNLSVTFFTNSHVVGSTSIFLEFVKPNSCIRTVLYTSDMGSKINKDLQPYLFEDKLPRKCNLLISEATYSDKTRQFNKKDALQERKNLKQNIEKWLKEDKRILFTTFSFSREQLLMTMLYNWFKDEGWFNDIPIVIDGVLVHKVNKAYTKVLQDDNYKKFMNVLHWKNFKFNSTYEGTKAILSKRTTGIYLANSGFCENGKVVSYLQKFLGNSNDVVVLTGFCGAKGSVGERIVNNEQKTISLEKRKIVKRAEIQQLRTFSSHITYDELLQLFVEMNCDKILIHHCNEKNKYSFCEEAKDYALSKNKSIKIVPVNKGADQFVL